MTGDRNQIHNRHEPINQAGLRNLTGLFHWRYSPKADTSYSYSTALSTQTYTPYLSFQLGAKVTNLRCSIMAELNPKNHLQQKAYSGEIGRAQIT